MQNAAPLRRPRFCPNPDCDYHLNPEGWIFKRKGFYLRQAPPRRIQRFLCVHCKRNFSSQTFSPSYWLKRPQLLAPLFFRLLGCSAFRQIAREFEVAPTTVQRQAARLGRHCLLFHERHRPAGRPAEPLVLDGLRSFEFGHYWPYEANLAIGVSHFVYGFSDAELRRSGRMTARQRRKRRRLEQRYGRPDPRATEHAVRELVARLVARGHAAEIRSDEHRAYRRALRRLADRRLTHRVTPSTAPRTPRNPLFPVNLADLLVRHTGAHHKRETIAFSKRRQSGLYRMAVFVVWRNYLKSFSERRQDATPAQRLGLMARKLRVAELLRTRLFPSRMPLPAQVERYYFSRVRTRRLRHNPEHRCRYAF